jgi:hypothetical protein
MFDEVARFVAQLFWIGMMIGCVLGGLAAVIVAAVW